MTVICKLLSVGLRLLDNSDKTLCSFHNIKADAHPNSIVLFSDAIETLRGETVGSRYLTTTTELEELV